MAVVVKLGQKKISPRAMHGVKVHHECLGFFRGSHRVALLVHVGEVVGGGGRHALVRVRLEGDAERAGLG